MTARAAAKPSAKAAANSAALDVVFDEFKTILARYASWFTVREGPVKNKRDYHLILQKPLVIDGRKRDELWFASIIQQKDSVGAGGPQLPDSGNCGADARVPPRDDILLQIFKSSVSSVPPW